MARIKSGPSGLYYDENDSGPDQGSPEEIAAFKAKQTTAPQTPQYDSAGSAPSTPAPRFMDYLMGTADPNAGGARPDPNVLQTVQNPQGNEWTNSGDGSGWATTDGSAVPAAAPAPTAAPAGQPSYAYMEGVDTSKMSNQSHTTPKYQAARILASGGSLADAAAAIGATVIGPDTMRLATGETIDTRRDIEGANQLQWLVTNDPNDPNWGKPAAGAGGAGTPGAGGIGAGGAMSGQAGSLFDMLMNKAGQSLNIDRKDPIIANQANAFDAANVRSNRDYMKQLAEESGPQANLGLEARMMAESRGQKLGAFQGQLMQQELTARRAEIMQALQLSANFMTDQQKLALSKELAMLDNALQYAQLGQRAYEFDSSDEFRRSPLAS